MLLFHAIQKGIVQLPMLESTSPAQRVVVNGLVRLI